MRRKYMWKYDAGFNWIFLNSCIYEIKIKWKLFFTWKKNNKYIFLNNFIFIIIIQYLKLYLLVFTNFI